MIAHAFIWLAPCCELPNLLLHRRGFSTAPLSRLPRVGPYPTISTLPGRVKPLARPHGLRPCGLGRCIFCCTFPELQDQGLTCHPGDVPLQYPRKISITLCSAAVSGSPLPSACTEGVFGLSSPVLRQGRSPDVPWMSPEGNRQSIAQ